MDTEEKGCVYFFKHIGLTPVKIGYTTSNSPISRFKDFKTYAPYGAEIVGFFQTKDANKIESELHQKFSSKRLDGEWFNLTKEEVDEILRIYTEKTLIEEKNNFQIEFAKHLDETKNKNCSKITFLQISNFEKIKIKYKQNPNFNKTHFARELNITRAALYKHLKKIKKS
jgi:hypothetical protein